MAATQTNKRLRTKDLVYVAVSAALITVCAWISVPTVVPFTLQTFGVLIIIGLFGTVRSAAAVSVYIFMGIVGLPVFSGFRSGIGTVAGATGGYIIGFLATCIVSGTLIRLFKKSLWGVLIAFIAGQLVCYAFGSTWYELLYTGADNISFLSVLTVCVVPFLIPDAVKLTVAALLTVRLKRFVK